jgi:hypothetical protein
MRGSKAMSKFLCRCGYVIIDQMDYLPYKASFFLDTDTNLSFERFYSYLHDLQLALNEGNLQDFFDKTHGKEAVQGSFCLEDSIAMMFGGLTALFGHNMYECEQCGRIWLQVHRDMNRFIPFLPESNIRGILKADNDEKKRSKE